MAPRALEAVVDVVVWGSDQPKRQGRSIREPGVLPIGPGDSLRLDVRLQSAMHLYVVWIDAAGELYPVYPWQPGSWDAGLENPGPVDSISLPEKLDTAWPNKGVGGLETLVLLAAPHPLAEISVRPLPDSSKAAPEPAQPASDAAPSDFDLRKVLAELPKAPKQDARLFFEFDQNGALRLGQDRSPQFAQQQLLEDHVQQTRQFIVERLAPRFALVRVLRFANRGPEEEPDRADKPPTDSPKSEP